MLSEHTEELLKDRTPVSTAAHDKALDGQQTACMGQQVLVVLLRVLLVLAPFLTQYVFTGLKQQPTGTCGACSLAHLAQVRLVKHADRGDCHLS
jgi:hypothetical protein